MIDERWLPVIGFEGQYAVSNHGRVKRCAREFRRSDGQLCKVSELILSQHAHGRDRGYRAVTFKVARGTSRSSLVHRLVARAFHPNPDGLPEVNHKDLIKSNNYFENLEWATGRGNIQHATKRGKFHGQTNPNMCRKLRPEQVEVIRARLLAGAAGVALAEDFGVSRSLISMIKSGTKWADPSVEYAHVA